MMKDFSKAILVAILTITLMFGLTACGEISPFEEKYNQGYNDGLIAAKYSENYHFYLNWGSLPTLFTAAHFMSHEYPTWVYSERINSYDLSNLPQHVNLLTGNTTQANANVVFDTLSAKINELENKSKNAFFNFFIDDYRLMHAFAAAHLNGIPQERYHVTLLSDGTATYSGLFIPIDTVAKWNITRASFETELAKFDNKEENAMTGSEMYNASASSAWAHVASQRSNVAYWMQFPEYFFINSNVPENLKAEFMKCKHVKMQPFDLVNKLNVEQRDYLFDNWFCNPANQIDGKSVSKADLDAMLIRTPESKPALIYVGNRLDTVANTALEIARLNKIVDDFGTEYDIFYKGHPGHSETNATAEGFVEFCAENRVTILPRTISFEIYMWVYPEILYGGGGGTSTWMGVPDGGKVLFLFGNMTSIQGVLYDYGFFGNVQKIYTDGNPPIEI